GSESCLSCDGIRAGLANHRHSDLAGKAEVLLNVLGKCTCQYRGAVIVDLVRLNDNTEFTALRHRVDVVDALVLGDESLKCFHALDIGVTVITARSWPRR